jgi:hypothetical protein
MGDIEVKLNELVYKLDKEYRQWYKRKSIQSFWLWFILQIFAITPGFVVSILVALSDNYLLPKYKPWIVILSGLGSFVGFILVQFKVYDIWKIRADGEVAFENLYHLALRKVAMAKSENDCNKVYKDITRLINEIESDAVNRYFSLSNSEFIATWNNK